MPMNPFSWALCILGALPRPAKQSVSAATSSHGLNVTPFVIARELTAASRQVARSRQPGRRNPLIPSWNKFRDDGRIGRYWSLMVDLAKRQPRSRVDSMMAARLRSTSSSVVAQDETLIRSAAFPRHAVPPHQRVPSRWTPGMACLVNLLLPKETST